LYLFPGQRVARGAIDRVQPDDIFISQTGNGAADDSLARRSLAHFPRNIFGKFLARWPVHLAKDGADFSIGKNVQER